MNCHFIPQVQIGNRRLQMNYQQKEFAKMIMRGDAAKNCGNLASKIMFIIMFLKLLYLSSRSRVKF